VKKSFSSIRKTVELYKPDNIYLVSKCGEIIQSRTLEWLHKNNFFSETGVLESNIEFCLERKDKKGICEKFEIDIFIDDRFSVLIHLLNLKRLILFRPNEIELNEYSKFTKTKKITVVSSWEEILEILI